MLCLAWLGLAWLGLAWLDLACLVLSCLALPCPVLSCGLTWACFALSCPSCPVFFRLVLSRLVLPLLLSSSSLILSSYCDPLGFRRDAKGHLSAPCRMVCIFAPSDHEVLKMYGLLLALFSVAFNIAVVVMPPKLPVFPVTHTHTNYLRIRFSELRSSCENIPCILVANKIDG
jgi:hypothetical protein